MRLHSWSGVGKAARRMSPLVCAALVSAAAAGPAGAESTTTITSASCVTSGSTTTFSVAWSGKTPYWYNVFFATPVLPGRFDDAVPKPNDDSLTVTSDQATFWGPPVLAIISLHGKPHGNTEPIWPSLGPLKDRIEVACA